MKQLKSSIVFLVMSVLIVARIGSDPIDPKNLR